MCSINIDTGFPFPNTKKTENTKEINDSLCEIVDIYLNHVLFSPIPYYFPSIDNNF